MVYMAYLSCGCYVFADDERLEEQFDRLGADALLLQPTSAEIKMPCVLHGPQVILAATQPGISAMGPAHPAYNGFFVGD